VTERQTDRYTDYHKNEVLPVKYIRRWNDHFGLDVNRSTFDEDMRDKRFLHIRF